MLPTISQLASFIVFNGIAFFLIIIILLPLVYREFQLKEIIKRNKKVFFLLLVVELILFGLLYFSSTLRTSGWKYELLSLIQLSAICLLPILLTYILVACYLQLATFTKPVRFIFITLFILIYLFFYPKETFNHGNFDKEKGGYKVCSCMGFDNNRTGFESCMGMPYKCEYKSREEVCGGKYCIWDLM